MCKSAAEGGQRCHSDANTAMIAANTVHEAAMAAHAADPTSANARAVAQAREAFVATQEDLASTRTGMAKVQAMIGNPAAPSETVEHGRRLLKVGKYLRERNAAIGAANADLAAGRPVFGGTGDEHTDWSVEQAARLIAADPDRFREPPQGRLAGVKTYASVAEQREGLAKRLRTLQGTAFTFAVRQRDVLATQDFDAMLDGAVAMTGSAPDMFDQWRSDRAPEDQARTQWRDRAAVEVLILAHRYARARAQTPPVSTPTNTGTWVPADGETVWASVDGQLVQGTAHEGRFLPG